LKIARATRIQNGDWSNHEVLTKRPNFMVRMYTRNGPSFIKLCECVLDLASSGYKATLPLDS